ncbi:MAG: BamA/TamA family outer membrane protein [Desulfatibacillum sp.]|nr:BamA/TamA family outer membrane protein [Desulfatibacillum sp.]
MKYYYKMLINLLVLLLITGPALAAPGADWIVDKVQIHGLKTVSPKKAKAVLSVKPANIRPWVKDQTYVPALVDADLKTLLNLMNQEGFFEAEVTSSLEEKPKKKKVTVLYTIKEGPPVLLESMEIQGIDGLPHDLQKAIQGFTPLKPGERLRTESYGYAKDQIVTLLNNNGYPHAVVSGSIMVDKKKKTANAAITVAPGAYSLFGPVSVTGLEKTDPDVILSRLTFEEGQMYTRKEIVETQREIFALGFLSKVSILPAEAPEQAPQASETTASTGEPGNVPLEISGEYKKFKSLRFGVGYGTEENVRVQAGWRHRHLTSQARRFELSLKYSGIVQSAEAEILQPRFFSNKQELKDTLGAKRQDEISYIDVSVYNDISVSRKLSRYWQGTLGHQLELHRPEEYSVDLTGDATETQTNYLISSLAFGLERDTRPKVLTPRSGAFFSNHYWYGSSDIGSEIDYYKISVEGSVLIPLGDYLVLATKAHFSGIEALEDTETVPLFMRLFAGGTRSVRGYAYQQMGPTNEDGDFVGGQSLWEGSVELRFPIYQKISGVVFSDCGSVVEEPFSFDGRSFRYTTGPGLRYESPVGALSLDIGYQLNPQDDYKDTYRVHFSVGNAF